jgi:hypothetical protein
MTVMKKPTFEENSVLILSTVLLRQSGCLTTKKKPKREKKEKQCQQTKQTRIIKAM